MNPNTKSRRCKKENVKAMHKLCYFLELHYNTFHHAYLPQPWFEALWVGFLQAMNEYQTRNSNPQNLSGQLLLCKIGFSEHLLLTPSLHFHHTHLQNAKNYSSQKLVQPPIHLLKTSTSTISLVVREELLQP